MLEVLPKFVYGILEILSVMPETSSLCNSMIEHCYFTVTLSQGLKLPSLVYIREIFTLDQMRRLWTHIISFRD